MTEEISDSSKRVLAALIAAGWRIKQEYHWYILLEREGYRDYQFIFSGYGMTPRSYNDVPMRLSNERLAHILEGHPEVSVHLSEILHTLITPQRIYAGKEGELLALREVEPEKWLVVVYRESTLDMEKTAIADIEAGSFVITAYLTRRIRSFEKRQRIL
ncbi:MAG TPA: hypothetical protein V6D10_20565 [Trichocoleus sp.]|jgi:hypothetical protein